MNVTRPPPECPFQRGICHLVQSSYESEPASRLVQLGRGIDSNTDQFIRLCTAHLRH